MIKKPYYPIILVTVFLLTGIILALTKSSKKIDVLFESNVEALAQSETNNNETACRLAGGVWNHVSICADGGVIPVSCEYEGQITIFGITVKGTYKAGCTYVIAWARYSCEQPAQNECCTKQGIFIGDQQVA